MSRTGAVEVSVFGAVWRHRFLVLGAAALGAILMWALGAAIPGAGAVEATASVVVSDASEFTIGAADQPARFVGNQVEILRSLSVTNRTVDLLEQNGFEEVNRSELRDDLRVVASENSDEIVIRYSGVDPARAVATVNAVLQAYDEINKEQTEATAQEALDRIDAEIEVLGERLVEISQQITELETTDPVLSALTQQAGEAFVQLAILQDEFDATSDPETQAEIATELAEIRARIGLFVNARSSASATPDVQALLESQSRTIERRATLVERRDQILIDTALTPGIVAFQDPAVATTPVPGFSGMRAVAAGLVLGLVAGAAYATLRANVRDAVVSRQEVAEILGAPVLASVPEFRLERLRGEVPAIESPASAAAEAYRFAVTSLATAAKREAGRVVLIASPTSGQGKTTTVANVGLAAAQQGMRVLAVDADFEEQDLSALFDDPKSDGLPTGMSEAIADSALTLSDLAVEIPIGFPGMHLMSRGHEIVSPSAITQSEASKRLLNEAKRKFDLILVDSPPLLRVAYTSDLMKLADVVVAVVPRGCAVSDLVEFRERCEFLHATIIGFIFTHDVLSVGSQRTDEPVRSFFGREIGAEAPSLVD